MVYCHLPHLYPSQASTSHKSSRTSTKISVSAAATRARAKAEAAKIKVSNAEKQAAMMKQKALIEANHVLKQEKEATATSKEAAIFEEAAAEHLSW